MVRENPEKIKCEKITKNQNENCGPFETKEHLLFLLVTVGLLQSALC